MPPSNFQTSFIPKKPIVEPVVTEKVGLGIFGFIGVLIFVISSALAGGVYFYEGNLNQQLTDKQTQLSNARNSLEPSLMASAKTLGRRITDANEILSNHIIVSPIFQALQLNTLKSIQFTNFSYKTPSGPKDKVSIQLSGIARDYTSIALESDQLAKNKDIQNPLFSGLSLDSQTGKVNFSLDFTVSQDLVSFVKHVSEYQDIPSTASSTNPGDNSNPVVDGQINVPQIPSLASSTDLGNQSAASSSGVAQ